MKKKLLIIFLFNCILHSNEDFFEKNYIFFNYTSKESKVFILKDKLLPFLKKSDAFSGGLKANHLVLQFFLLNQVALNDEQLKKFNFELIDEEESIYLSSTLHLYYKERNNILFFQYNYRKSYPYNEKPPKELFQKFLFNYSNNLYNEFKLFKNSIEKNTKIKFLFSSEELQKKFNINFINGFFKI